MNGMMLQGFSWYLPPDGQHWRRMAERSDELAELGFTAVWLPPAYKGSRGASDVGYGAYDLWDLGEFDQKDTVRTKYGTREDYVACVQAFQSQGIQVLGDIVLNHKMGGDELEEVEATEMDPSKRSEAIGEPETINTWCRFTFPGRAGMLDDFVWDASCFTSCDWNDDEKESGLWLFEGKEWAEDVDLENENFDYLMGLDVDLTNEKVYEQLLKWGRWYLETTGVNGLRLDALKHMSRSFYKQWLKDMRASVDHELFVVGEYWKYDLGALRSYIDEVGDISLFDVPLHFNFFNASQNRDGIDFTRIFDNTLVANDPIHAVTFVENHDTQPDQALASTVQHWFKPAAYAMILLREAGYPCVFFADLYGLPNDGIPAVAELPLLMEVRRTCAYGEQHDYLDEPDLVGWTRSGSAENPGCAVLLSHRNGGTKLMDVGASHAGERWVCVLGEEDSIEIGEDGCAEFRAHSALVSVYLPEAAAENLSNIPILVRPTQE